MRLLPGMTFRACPSIQVQTARVRSGGAMRVRESMIITAPGVISISAACKREHLKTYNMLFVGCSSSISAQPIPTRHNASVRRDNIFISRVIPHESSFRPALSNARVGAHVARATSLSPSATTRGQKRRTRLKTTTSRGEEKKYHHPRKLRVQGRAHNPVSVTSTGSGYAPLTHPRQHLQGAQNPRIRKPYGVPRPLKSAGAAQTSKPPGARTWWTTCTSCDTERGGRRGPAA